jgi:hypothetical protein
MIIDPAFYGYCVICCIFRGGKSSVSLCFLTLMKLIAQRAVVQNHDLAQIWLNRAQIFDEGTISICTVLAIVSTRKELAFLL